MKETKIRHFNIKTMEYFNFYPLLIQNGIEPDGYVVNQSFSGCHATITVISTYRNPLANADEQWRYIFYLWRSISPNGTGYHTWLSCFEKHKIKTPDDSVDFIRPSKDDLDVSRDKNRVTNQ